MKLLIGDDLGMATRVVLGVQFPPLRLSNFFRPPLTMPHLLFKWVLREDRYEFSGQAKTPRSLENKVDAEIVGKRSAISP
ncbi:MAG TPA: hypothetical protein VGO04_09625 [Ensifer sp.]|uniref:hypothetical protein n=1 Tax=Ensifer sp. TaxID=1872086 RepID=UPI002E0D512D|nr:hypothetical protein [Ensifer sp.]